MALFSFCCFYVIEDGQVYLTLQYQLLVLQLSIMDEMYSKAIVLKRTNIGEVDSLISLFTKKFGKITVKARGIRKITSKLSACFQPATFVKTRFIPMSKLKTGFVLIDGVIDDFSIKNNTKKRYDMLPVLDFMSMNYFDLQRDDRMWHFLIKIFSKHYKIDEVLYVMLSIFGLPIDDSYCFICNNKDIVAFNNEFQKFLCRKCSLRFSKNNLFYIKRISFPSSKKKK